MISAILGGGYTCEHVAEMSSAFIDGELSTAQWLRMRLHLLTCPPCKEFTRQLGITVDLLRSMPGEEGHQMRADLMEAFASWSQRDHR